MIILQDSLAHSRNI